MPPTWPEGYVCSYCDRPYLDIPQPGERRPPYPQCLALLTHLNRYDPSHSTWDMSNTGGCAHCKRGDHDKCVDWFCLCDHKYGGGPCSPSEAKARAVATGQPWHEPKPRAVTHQE